MSLGAALQVAFTALLVHKGRSALTCLGIIIGIAAVIALVAAGDGAREELDERLQSIGKNLILIRAGARSQQGIVSDMAPLTFGDADAIRKEVGMLLVGVAATQLTQRLVSSRTGREATSARCKCGRFAVLTERLKPPPRAFVAPCRACQAAGSICVEVIPDSLARGMVPLARLEADMLVS